MKKLLFLIGFWVIFIGCANVWLWMVLFTRFELSAAAGIAFVLSGALMVGAYLFVERKVYREYAQGSLVLAKSACATLGAMALLSWGFVFKADFPAHWDVAGHYSLCWLGFFLLGLSLAAISAGLGIYRRQSLKRGKKQKFFQ